MAFQFGAFWLERLPEEHRQMTWGDVQLHMEADRTEYLDSERQTKTRTVAEPRNVGAVKPKAFAVLTKRST